MTRRRVSYISARSFACDEREEMKTATKKLDNGKRELTVEVSGDPVKQKFEEVFAKIAKEAKVPGFRPGHAPRDIIEKNFSAHAHDQVLKELIPDVYEKAVAQEKLDVVELPEVTNVKLDRATLVFKATVEVSPEIKIKEYKGLKVNYKKIEVSPDEIKRSLDSFKESRKIEAIDDALARSSGYPNVAELEKTLEKQIFIQKENAQRQKIENDLIEQLTKDLNFRIPLSMIERQLENMVRQAKVDLAMKGVPREQIAEHEQALAAQMRPQAEKEVKVYLVLSEIAKKETIAIDDHMGHHVMEFLLREANWQEEA